jgi:glycosyltransferase involved in cell wall biosynthesis
MIPGVSVIVCCHNSARRLPETLRHLAAQQLPAAVAWELIVIDNASTDDTAAVAVANWPATPPAPLRVVAEPQPGLHCARIRGIREARHEIISFIDDDNWVSPDWVARIDSDFAAHPEMGVCGGRSIAATEMTPPPWFESIQRGYAVGPQYAQTGEVTNSHGSLLWGAGLSIRTSALRQLLDEGFVFQLSGRKGTQVLAGEDTEVCFALWARGLRFWYDDALIFSHFIPKERLHWNYAQRMCVGMGNSSVLLELYLFALRRPPFAAYPAWKKTWTFQILKCLRGLAVTLLSAPLDCLRRPEGSDSALRYVTLKSSLKTLWSMRRSYGDILRNVELAPWRGPT